MLNLFISITAIKGKRTCYVGCYQDKKTVARIIEDIPAFVGPGWKAEQLEKSKLEKEIYA